jgi:DNA-directed RNA polymerase specialized sigma subunit
MDLIQNSAEGLMVAIDKFTPPYKTVFRSTAIGRMTLNMMTDYNATLVKLPPREKRILYRHGIAKNRKNIENDAEALDFVKESFKNVTQENLQQIVNAATSVQSLDWRPEDGISLSDKLSGGLSPEDVALVSEKAASMVQGIDSMIVIERKVVTMKTGY